MKKQLLSPLLSKKLSIRLIFIYLFFQLVFVGNIQAQTCNCNRYLYVNDQQARITEKFRINTPAQVAMLGTQYTEIGNPFASFPTGAFGPHGLAQDVNGKIYIGNDTSGPIKVFSCDGAELNSNFQPLGNGGFNFFSKNGLLISNPYIDASNQIITGTLKAFDLCTNTQVGTVEFLDPFTGGLDGGNYNWGLAEGDDGEIYASTTRGNIYRFSLNPTTFTNNTQVAPIINVESLKATYGLFGSFFGIDADAAGNIYLFFQGGDGALGTSALFKFNAAGTLINHILLPNAAPTGGAGAGRGLVYDYSTNLIFVAGGQPGNADCVAAYDANTLAYVPVFSMPHVPGQFPKGIAIATECCLAAPTGTTITNQNCQAQVGTKYYLQDLFNSCDGPICGATWTDLGSTGLTFNACDNSVTVTSLDACGSFNISTPGGIVCPTPASATFNFSLQSITAPTFVTPTTACIGTDPGAFTPIITASSTGGALTYQWQESTSPTGPWTNITTNGNGATYDPPAGVTGTKFYKVIVNSVACTNGTCTVESPVVEVTAIACELMSLGSTVFKDINDDGIQSGDAEIGIPGITVNLYLASSPTVVFKTTTTDTDGNYFFDDLQEGNYIVGIPTPPVGLIRSSTSRPNENGDNNIDNNDNGIQTTAGGPVFSPTINLTAGAEPLNATETGQGGLHDTVADDNGNMTVDFGFVPNNTTITESKICNCAPGLFYYSNEPQELRGQATVNAPTGETWTVQSHTGLIKLDPILDIPMPIDEPLVETPAGSGVYLIDYGYKLGVDYTLTVTNGTITRTLEFFGDICEKTVISNNLTNFTNMCPTDPPVTINGSAVFTFNTVNGGQSITQNGTFVYSIEEATGTRPNQTFTVVSSNVTSFNPATLTVGKNYVVRAIYTPAVGERGCPLDYVYPIAITDVACLSGLSIGSTVFIDNDNNAVQDPTDTGISGVKVTLYDAANTPIRSVFTNAQGNYYFGNLTPGTYKVGIAAADLPGIYTLSSTNPTTPTDNDADLTDDWIQTGGNGTDIISPPIVLTTDGESVTESNTTDPLSTLLDGPTNSASDKNGNMTVDFGLIDPTTLPVDLISFNATAIQDKIVLNWNVSAEKNFSHYEVQKSLDAKEFGSIGKVISNATKFYNYQDFSPELGNNYYRLKMIDLDGSSDLSNIVSVNFEKNSNYLIVENPAQNGQFKITTNFEKPKFSIINSSGRKIEFNLSKIDNTNFMVKTKNAPAGIYFLNMESNGRIQSRKVLIP